MSKEKLVPKLRFEEFINTGEWKKVQLNDVSHSFEYGLNASAKSYDGINKYLRITDIDDENRRLITDNLTSPKIKIENSEKFILKEGDILFARTGASVGKSYKYDLTDGKVYYAGYLIRARIKSDYDHNFVFYNTLTNSYHNFIKLTSQRSGQPGVNASEYSKYEFYISSLDEQNKVGSFFNKIDQIIQLQQSKVNKIKDIKSAYLSEMFPKKGEKYPKKRFKGFQRGWDTSNIGQITRINKGKQLNKENMVENGRYYVLNGGITPSGYTNTYNTEGETISISEGGNSCGYVNYNKEKFWSGGHNYALTNLKTNVSFLYYFLKSRQDSIMSLRVGSGLPNIQITALFEFDVLYPLKDEQKKIGQFFKNLDKQILIEEEKLAKLENLKQAYLNDMFV